MTFPLFKLPILVIKIVLETMGFIDLFLLTSSSTKTKRIVKNLVTIRNHTLRVFMKEQFFFFDFCSNSDSDPNSPGQIYLELEESQPKDVFYMKIGTIARVPSEFSEATDGTVVLTIFWNPTVINVAKLYNALFDVFRMPLKGIQMNVEGVTFETCRSWINWNNDTASDASVLEFVGKCSFHTYISMLKLVRTKNSLSYRAEPTDYPKNPETIDIFDVEVKEIIIRYGTWINVLQLKAIRAEVITITKASLTDPHINSILREMRDSEGTFNWKTLYIILIREPNTEMVLEGIDVTDEDLIKPDDALNQWSFEMANGEKCRMIYAQFKTDARDFGFEFHVGV